MRVSRSKLEAGMKLEQDVIDSRGRLLAPAGLVLTERHIAAFRSWDVPSAEIAPEEGAEGAVQGDLPELGEKQEWRIRQRFEHTDLEHPFMQALLEECLVRARRQLALELRENPER